MKVILFLFAFCSIVPSCKKTVNENNTTSINNTGPTVLTSSVTSITDTSAISGGTISDQGTSSVIARGVCWSYLDTPTIADDASLNGSGNGAFVSDLLGLVANKTYFVRAYATTNAGTVYGPEINFHTDALPSFVAGIYKGSCAVTSNPGAGTGFPHIVATHPMTITLNITPPLGNVSIYSVGGGIITDVSFNPPDLFVSGPYVTLRGELQDSTLSGTFSVGSAQTRQGGSFKCQKQ